MKIAIIGAGRIGSSLAKAFSTAGHEVYLANRSGGEKLAQIANHCGAMAASVKEAARCGEIVVISLPLKAIADLPTAEIGAKIVIDTCNYYPNRDGIIAQLEEGMTTSCYLAQTLTAARIVKAFNSILANDLANRGRPLPNGVLHTLPLAADDAKDADAVFNLVRAAGLSPFYTGPLAESWRFERARPAYCKPMSEADLASTLAATKPEDFVPEGSWHD